MLEPLGQLAVATQSQIPMRVGDCVKSNTPLEFFYKDEGEYERTHLISDNQYGVVLNVDEEFGKPSSVEFLDAKTREPIVNGAAYFHQFHRVPWLQGNLQSVASTKCMTVKDGRDGYQPVVRMTDCAAEKSERERWAQQFSFNEPGCGARPIRLTDNPGKCVDAVHPTKVLLTDCSGVDSQKFLFRCIGEGDNSGQCHILAMGGRKDMCLWFDKENGGDLQIRPCNFGDAPTHIFKQAKVTPNQLLRQETRPNSSPATV